MVGGSEERGLAPPEPAPREDFRPQSALSREGLDGALAESFFHPETGFGLFCSQKSQSLDFEFPADQSIEILPLDDDIPPVAVRASVRNGKLVAEAAVGFDFEKGDLAFVIRLVIEVAIPPDSAPGDAFDVLDLDDRSRPGRSAVMPDVDVSWRDE